MVTTRNSTKGAKSSKSLIKSRQAPEKLEPKQVQLFRLLFVLCLTVLLPLGIYGLAVMMGMYPHHSIISLHRQPSPFLAT